MQRQIASGGVVLASLLSFASISAVEPEKQRHKLSPDSTAPVLPAAQQRPQILVYKTALADGSMHFSDQRPLNQVFELLRFDCYACAPLSNINWQNTPLYTQRFAKVISQAAAEHQVDVALIRAVIHAESAFNPQAISVKGATGLMQLMPATMQQFKVSDGHEPEQNIRAGSQYLAQLIKDFNGELPLALAAYNAGPAAVRRYNGIPPFAETQAYIERVHILMQRYAKN